MTTAQPFEHSFNLTVKVDGFWVEYLTQNTDIFHPHYAGYWLRGIALHHERGWLCWEDDEKTRKGEEPDSEAALAAWARGDELPKGWYRLDRAAALRAWEEGVKHWGVNWYDQVDSTREDVVVQLALLGEVRYG